MRVPAPMLRASPITAHGPDRHVLAQAPQRAPITADGCTPLAAAQASAAWPPAQTTAAADPPPQPPSPHCAPYPSRHPACTTTAPAAPRKRLRSRRRILGKDQIQPAWPRPSSHARQAPVSALPCTSLPPSCFDQFAQRHASRLNAHSIQPRLPRRPRLPAPVNPQPLVRIAPNPRLQSPPCTAACPPEYRHSHRPSAESQPPARSAARTAAPPPPTA